MIQSPQTQSFGLWFGEGLTAVSETLEPSQTRILHAVWQDHKGNLSENMGRTVLLLLPTGSPVMETVRSILILLYFHSCLVRHRKQTNRESGAFNSPVTFLL